MCSEVFIPVSLSAYTLFLLLALVPAEKDCWQSGLQLQLLTGLFSRLLLTISIAQMRPEPLISPRHSCLKWFDYKKKASSRLSYLSISFWRLNWTLRPTILALLISFSLAITWRSLEMEYIQKKAEAQPPGRWGQWHKQPGSPQTWRSILPASLTPPLVARITFRS